MKWLYVFVIAVVFVAALAISRSELANPFTGAAQFNTTQVNNEHQSAVNTIEEQAYQKEVQDKLAIQEAQAQAEVERIQSQARQDQAIRDAQTQATLDEIARRKAESDALSQQAIQHDLAMKQQEQARMQSENTLKLELTSLAVYALVGAGTAFALALSIGWAIQIARKPAKWTDGEKRRVIQAARDRERQHRWGGTRAPQPVPVTPPIIRSNGNGHKEYGNTPYNELPRAG